MQERLHEHINLELRTNTTTDTIFILAAIIFNFMMLCIGSAAAAGAAGEGPAEMGPASIIIYIITLILTLIVNGIVVIGLITGRGTRKLLSSGLLKMYKDAQVVGGIELALTAALAATLLRRI